MPENTYQSPVPQDVTEETEEEDLSCPECGEEDPTVCSGCDGVCEDCCGCVDCGARCCTRRVESVCESCKRCDHCCSCWTCEGCDSQFSEDDSSCSNCNYCEHCCECRYCEVCSEPVASEYFCRECSNCTNHCDCSSSECPVAFLKRPLTFRDGKSFAHNQSKRHIAVEIEIAKAGSGSAINDVAGQWCCSIVHDSSLPDSGFEIATAPAQGDTYIDMVSDLTDALTEQDAEVNDACGLHVHVDARNMDYYAIHRLIVLYSKIEDALFLLIPKSRRSSGFCKPCGQRYLDGAAWKNGELKDKVEHATYGYSPNEHEKKEKYNSARYAALNLHSWFYRGTVECRLFAGTIKKDKIINWGILWAAVLDNAARMSDAEVDALAGESIEILLSLCPTDEVRRWVTKRYNHFST